MNYYKMKEDKYDEIINDMFMSAKQIKEVFIKIARSNKKIKLLPQNHILLEILAKKGAIPMSDIGNNLCIAKPNLTKIIEELTEEGLVKRVYDKTDRRVIKIQITTKGEEHLSNARELIKETFKKMLCSLDKKDVENLSKSISDINRIVSKLNVDKKDNE